MECSAVSAAGAFKYRACRAECQLLRKDGARKEICLNLDRPKHSPHSPHSPIQPDRGANSGNVGNAGNIRAVSRPVQANLGQGLVGLSARLP
jgi:hypothetical protein